MWWICHMTSLNMSHDLLVFWHFQFNNNITLYPSTKVLWSSSWTRGSLRCIHLHPAPWKLIWSTFHWVFFSSFVHPSLDFLWAHRRVFLESSGLLPYRCTYSGAVWVAHLLLLLCMCCFSYLMFFVVYVCFPCLIIVLGLHSFDFR